jgi:hypothetical protein
MVDKCSKCGSSENLVVQTIRKNKKYYYCRPCRTDAFRKYRRTEKGRIVCLNATKNWEKKNQTKIKTIRRELCKKYRKLSYNLPDQTRHNKYKARDIVKNRIYRGKIIRQKCILCDKMGEAHHEDYSKPLSIIWLCKTHHLKYHYKQIVIDKNLEVSYQ